MYKRLYIWVEGNDDRRFFERVVKPSLEGSYDWIHIQTFAERKKHKVDSFLQSIRAMGADYILVTDLHSAPCVTRKKQDICERFRKAAADRTIIVVKEIESWYIAGLDAASCTEIGIKCLRSTDALNKQQFNNLIPRRFASRIDFQVEILDRFSIQRAIRKNRSFRYFAEKHDLG